MPIKKTKNTEVFSNTAVAPKAAATAVKPEAITAVKIRTQSSVSTHKTRTASTTTPAEITTQQIADLAYFIWLDRGCPAGTSEEDWYRAESELRAQSSLA